MALGVLVFFFVVVTVVGFAAAPLAAAELTHRRRVGPGRPQFGGWITWFLLGGDLYTAYTFVAVPARCSAPARSASSPSPTRSWSTRWCSCSCPGCGRSRTSTATSPRPTSSAGRYGSRELALAVAITGIVATMPYIALQLVGIQAVLDAIGIGGKGTAFVRDLPLFIAFACSPPTPTPRACARRR